MVGRCWEAIGCSVFVGLLAFASASSAAEDTVGGATPRADSLVVSEIGPGVWLHTSWRRLPGGIDFPKNGLVVRRGDELWLVDTAWGDELTERLLEWVDGELGMPVTGAIVTHFHDDSMGGTPALDARGIPSWAHPLTLELGVDEGVPLPRPVDRLEVGSSLRMGGMEVFYPGPAHTPDNVVVWLPDLRILFGTCAVRPGTSSALGNTADADLDEWPRSVQRMKDRFTQAEIVVPSHGEIGGPALLDHTIGLFGPRADAAPGRLGQKPSAPPAGTGS